MQQTVSNVELLEKVCKIFVPLAIANQITSKNAECIQASSVVEVASGIPTIEATTILGKRNVLLVLDLLAILLD
ncbi:MAG: hypothetical protein ACQEW5_24430 [Bacillota bacterium]